MNRITEFRTDGSEPNGNGKGAAVTAVRREPQVEPVVVHGEVWYRVVPACDPEPLSLQRAREALELELNRAWDASRRHALAEGALLSRSSSDSIASASRDLQRILRTKPPTDLSRTWGAYWRALSRVAQGSVQIEHKRAPDGTPQVFVTVEPQPVTVNVPQQPAPIVNVMAPAAKPRRITLDTPKGRVTGVSEDA